MLSGSASAPLMPMEDVVLGTSQSMPMLRGVRAASPGLGGSTSSSFAARAATPLRPPSSQRSVTPQRLLRSAGHSSPTRTYRGNRDEWRGQRQRENASVLMRHRQKATEKHDKEVDDLFASIAKAEAESEGFVRDISMRLQTLAEHTHRKGTKLCSEWHEQVFDRAQHQIDRQIDDASHKQRSQQRRADMQDYLRISNTKGLYRDIILLDEYDALAPASRGIKYGTDVLHDPLKRSLNLSEIEALPHNAIARPNQVGRETLPPTWWDKLDATPCRPPELGIRSIEAVDPSAPPPANGLYTRSMRRMASTMGHWSLHKGPVPAIETVPPRRTYLISPRSGRVRAPHVTTSAPHPA